MHAMRPPPPPGESPMDANAGSSRIGRRLRAAARRLALRWWDRARRCCGRPPASDDAARRDWAGGLPEDLMLVVMALMEVPDLVRSGAVCSSWRSAFNSFRSLRLPTAPNQPPCLLYATRHRMLLYSPSTDAAFCLQPSRLRPLRGVAGSAYGWLFATDDAANPHLLSPLTGAEVALPLLGTLERVKGGFMGANNGGIVYGVDYRRADSSPDIRPVTAKKARDYMYQRVAIAAPPAAAASGAAVAAAECVVLLVHMPYCEVSFARVGDERWTSISSQLSSTSSVAFIDRMLLAAAGGNLFYLMSGDGFVYVLDLAAGPAPVIRSKTKLVRSLNPYWRSYYLVVAPSGELLLVTRHVSREEHMTNDVAGYPHRKITTTTNAIYVDKIDLETGKMERLAGIGNEHALFLGHGSPVWIPIAKDGDHPLLRPNCVYLTDDSSYKPAMAAIVTREDLVVWDFGSGCLKKLADAWPHLYSPWMDEPAPIWITPSLY